MRITARSRRGGAGGGTPSGYANVAASALRTTASDTWIVSPTSGRCSFRLVNAAYNQNIGADNLTVWSRFQVPASLAANAGIWALTPSSTHCLNGSATTALALGVIAGRVAIIVGNSSTRTEYPLTTLSSRLGEFVDVVVVRPAGASTLTAYIDGVAQTLSPVDAAGAPVTPTPGSGVHPADPIDAQWQHTPAPLSATITNGNLAFSGPSKPCVVYNRAMTAADVARLMAYGIDPSDQWGSVEDVVSPTTRNGGFEAATGNNFDTWAESVSGSSTISAENLVVSPAAVPGYPASTRSCRMDVDAVGSPCHVQLNNLIQPGHRYRIRFDWRWTHPTETAPRRPQVQVTLTGVVASDLLPAVAKDTWQTYTVEVLADANYLRLFRTGGLADASYFYDNVVVEKIGAVSAPNPKSAGWQPENLANSIEGMFVNGAGTTNQGSPFSQVTWTCAASPEQMLGTANFSIPANAIITAVIVENISLGSGRTFSLGTLSSPANDLINAAPIDGNGAITLIDPSEVVATGQQLWASASASGSYTVTVNFTLI